MNRKLAIRSVALCTSLALGAAPAVRADIDLANSLPVLIESQIRANQQAQFQAQIDDAMKDQQLRAQMERVGSWMADYVMKTGHFPGIDTTDPNSPKRTALVALNGMAGQNPYIDSVYAAPIATLPAGMTNYLNALPFVAGIGAGLLGPGGAFGAGVAGSFGLAGQFPLFPGGAGPVQSGTSAFVKGHPLTSPSAMVRGPEYPQGTNPGNMVNLPQRAMGTSPSNMVHTPQRSDGSNPSNMAYLHQRSVGSNPTNMAYNSTPSPTWGSTHVSRVETPTGVRDTRTTRTYTNDGSTTTIRTTDRNGIQDTRSWQTYGPNGTQTTSRTTLTPGMARIDTPTGEPRQLPLITDTRTVSSWVTPFTRPGDGVTTRHRVEETRSGLLTDNGTPSILGRNIFEDRITQTFDVHGSRTVMPHPTLRNSVPVTDGTRPTPGIPGVDPFTPITSVLANIESVGTILTGNTPLVPGVGSGGTSAGIVAEQEGRIQIVHDPGLTIDDIERYRDAPPPDWAAAPGTITVVGNDEGLFVVWGADSSGRPVRQAPNSARIFLVSHRVFASRIDQL